jgi:hypothetical protein
MAVQIQSGYDRRDSVWRYYCLSMILANNKSKFREIFFKFRARPDDSKEFFCVATKLTKFRCDQNALPLMNYVTPLLRWLQTIHNLDVQRTSKYQTSLVFRSWKSVLRSNGLDHFLDLYLNGYVAKTVNEYCLKNIFFVTEMAQISAFLNWSN